MAWTPDRGPQTNPLRSGLSADASYDRAGLRTGIDYMDDDQQNPPAATKWWEVRALDARWLGWGVFVYKYGVYVYMGDYLLTRSVCVDNVRHQ